MQSPNVESLLKSAVSSHQAGRLDVAEKAYRSVLAASSDHPQALHLFGVLQHQRQRNKEALSLIDKAIALAPESWEFYCNRSLVLEALGRRQEAIAGLKEITAKTLDPAPWMELGFQLQRAGLVDEAVETLKILTENHPAEGRAWSLLGAVLQQLGRLEEAEIACHKAAGLSPSKPEVFNNLAIVQRVSGKLAESEANVRKAIELQVDFASGWDNLGQIKSASGDVPGMFEAFSRCAKLRHPVDGPLALRQRPRLARLRHDREQLEYLIERKLIDQRFGSCVQTLDAICERPTGGADEINPPVQITPAEQQVLTQYYDRMLVNQPVPAMDGGVLNPDLNLEEIQRAFLEQDAPYAVIDDFLKPEAIDQLYRYGLCSTVFFKEYNNGYLTTKMTDGFYSELLVQLAQEIPAKLSDIFGDSTLKEAWIFKCDSRMKALDTHADFAAVNVNLWLTPDTANANPESGGLTVFDKTAPADWSFESYNSKNDRVANYLKESGARPRDVHYRHNRALVFRSSLFHRSGAIHFRDGYENRRQNLTLLYGHKEGH
jgi:Flp pilus assembly protein TadD